jgi:hypothetical protein
MASRVLVNLQFEYSYLAKDPHWVDEDDDLVLAWGIGLRATKRDIDPLDLLLDLADLDTDDHDAVLALAKRYGPFFGGAFRTGDEQAIHELWASVVRDAPAEERDAVDRAYPYVRDLLLEQDDHVSIEVIANERERLINLGRRLGLLPSESSRAAESGQLNRYAAERLLRPAAHPLSASFAPELHLDREDSVVAPIFTVGPRDGYGIFALAELALADLIVRRSTLAQCHLPSCGKIFRRETRHHRQYCSEEHRSEMGNIRKRRKRAREGA